MLGTVFKEKLSFKDDNDNDTKVRAALLGAKEQRAKNDDECAFSRIRHRRRDSQNLSGAHGVLSHRRNPLKLCVPQAAGAHGDDGFGEMRM